MENDHQYLIRFHLVCPLIPGPGNVPSRNGPVNEGPGPEQYAFDCSYPMG